MTLEPLMTHPTNKHYYEIWFKVSFTPFADRRFTEKTNDADSERESVFMKITVMVESF